MKKPHLLLAHQLWESHLKPTDLAIDMTVGNGHDTLFLVKLLPEGQVIGFDIQEKAIEATRTRTEGHSLRVQLFSCSHTELKNISLPDSPRLIVYNLGYLPGGDHSITTQVDTTLESLDDALALLDLGGALSITCYPGHDEGKREEEAVFAWAKSQDGVNVSIHQWLERERAPSLVWVKKGLERL
ncbi:MAG TPA: class I SAM-dependent methyltransferase [Chlamydiales bacterium]|jgi:methylase of polypeptide subunit release factors